MLTDELTVALEAAAGEPPYRQDPAGAWRRAHRLRIRHRLLGVGAVAFAVVAVVVVVADPGAGVGKRATVVPASSPSPSAEFRVSRLSTVAVLRDGMATLAPAPAGEVPSVSAGAAFQSAKPRLELLPSYGEPVLSYGLYSDGMVGGNGGAGPVVDQHFKDRPMWLVTVPDVPQVVIFPPNYQGQRVHKTVGTVYILISATDGSWQGQFS